MNYKNVAKRLNASFKIIFTYNAYFICLFQKLFLKNILSGLENKKKHGIGKLSENIRLLSEIPIRIDMGRE